MKSSALFFGISHHVSCVLIVLSDDWTAGLTKTETQQPVPHLCSGDPAFAIRSPLYSDLDERLGNRAPVEHQVPSFNWSLNQQSVRNCQYVAHLVVHVGVCLAPRQVVPQMTVRGVQHNTAVKGGGRQQCLIGHHSWPAPYIIPREARRHQ